MRKIKKVFILSFLSFLVLSGCGKKHEEDAERLDEIDSKIELLFNEDRSDLADNISEEKLDDVNDLINEEEETEFNEENSEKMKSILSYYTLASSMYELDQQISDLFKDEILKENASKEDIDEVKEELKTFDENEQGTFVKRQSDLIEQADEQLEAIEEAESLVGDLFTEDDEVKEDISREDEDKAQDAVAEVKKQEVKEKLSSKLEKVDKELTKREEEARKKKEEEEQKQKEEEERKRKEEEEKQKAAKSIGDFKGNYITDDDFIIYITETEWLSFPNAPTDFFSDREITEIINNTGREITLVLDEEIVQTWKLSKDKQTLDAGSEQWRRLSQEEIDEIIEELPGVADLLSE